MRVYLMLVLFLLLTSVAMIAALVHAVSKRSPLLPLMLAPILLAGLVLLVYEGRREYWAGVEMNPNVTERDLAGDTVSTSPP